MAFTGLGCVLPRRLAKMFTEPIPCLIEFLKFFLGFIAQAIIFRGNAIGMPNKSEIFISLIHLVHGGTSGEF